MRVQDEKIKGFNVLELLIVIAIIGVLSAVAYPNFSDWQKDRETRSDVVEIKSLIEGINAQVQRGQYAFVQVDVEEGELVSGDDALIVTSKGMKPKTLATLLNDGGSTWWVEPNGRCHIVDETVVKADDETNLPLPLYHWSFLPKQTAPLSSRHVVATLSKVICLTSILSKSII